MSTATTLLNWRTVDFSSDEFDELESAPILVRSGRRSFYSNILSPKRTFLRYDPGCLEAVDDRGQAALSLVEHRLSSIRPEVHQWRRGDILIIDNWSVLHGRAPSGQESGRQLARILIDA
ncbi:MAG: TauD/TfdA family dioxygenase [Oceanibaculum sp.]